MSDSSVLPPSSTSDTSTPTPNLSSLSTSTTDSSSPPPPVPPPSYPSNEYTLPPDEVIGFLSYPRPPSLTMDRLLSSSPLLSKYHRTITSYTIPSFLIVPSDRLLSDENADVPMEEHWPTQSTTIRIWSTGSTHSTCRSE